MRMNQTANSNINSCTFNGKVTITESGSFEYVIEVTLTGTTTINGTLTIGEGSTLTNSGNLTCNVFVIVPTSKLPPLISVYGKLTNDKNSVINAVENQQLISYMSPLIIR